MPTTRHLEYAYPVLIHYDDAPQSVEIVFPPWTENFNQYIAEHHGEQITPDHPLSDVVNRLKGS